MEGSSTLDPTPASPGEGGLVKSHVATPTQVSANLGQSPTEGSSCRLVILLIVKAVESTPVLFLEYFERYRSRIIIIIRKVEEANKSITSYAENRIGFPGARVWLRTQFSLGRGYGFNLAKEPRSHSAVWHSQKKKKKKNRNTQNQN